MITDTLASAVHPWDLRHDRPDDFGFFDLCFLSFLVDFIKAVKAPSLKNKIIKIVLQWAVEPSLDEKVKKKITAFWKKLQMFTSVHSTAPVS